ncbi:MAG: serine/threonine-protein kinase [Gemmatimonadales bacterium]
MSPLSDADLTRLGTMLTTLEGTGRYTLHEVLGEGGMGIVYRGTDEFLEREVAVKVARDSTGPGSAALIERLRTEARVLARLEHPGIVPIHDAGILEDGRAFYVMKRIDGVTLDHALTGLAELDRKLGILERVAQTVAFAHQHGIVHRDLKPENIMVGGFGEVLVLDWGVAKLLETGRLANNGSRGTNPSMVLGTAGFMAPEQAGDSGSVDRRADVYALGRLLLYLMGDAPAAGTSDAPPAMSGWPRRLAAIARRCLAREPDGRYPDAGAVAEELARFRAGTSVTAYQEGPLDRLGRWIAKYRTPILLVLAYLLMRVLVALWSG